MNINKKRPHKDFIIQYTQILVSECVPEFRILKHRNILPILLETPIQSATQNCARRYIAQRECGLEEPLGLYIHRIFYVLEPCFFRYLQCPERFKIID